MFVYYPILLVFQALTYIRCSHLSLQGYTPLKINEIACTAEKLKSNGGRYTCNHEGEVHCTEGWQDEEPIDDANRCAIPKCDPSCKPHGICTSPNFCACEVGWDGAQCDICIPMPGCVNGACRQENVNGVEVEVAQTCECDKFPMGHPNANMSKYEGPKCDRPVCKPDCENDGWCVVSGDTRKVALAEHAGKCACPIGFTHDEGGLIDQNVCSKCMAMAGCNHGQCARMNPSDVNSVEIPGTCTCEDGYTGPLCDQLQCKDSSDAIIDCGEHGICLEDILDNGENGCACEAGWQGEKCDKCVPYWNCPNQNVDDPLSDDGLACVLPNQCICKSGGPALNDERGHLCNASAINGGVDDGDRK